MKLIRNPSNQIPICNKTHYVYHTSTLQSLYKRERLSTHLPLVLLLFQSLHQQLPEKEINQSNLNGRCLILNQPLEVSTDILEKTKYLFDNVNTMYIKVNTMIFKLCHTNVK